MEIIELSNKRSARAVKGGFWRRQFAREATNKQIVFDVALGAVGPILCFVFDPIAFHSGLIALLLPDYQAFAYLFSASQIGLLLMWLILRPVNPVGRRKHAGGGHLSPRRTRASGSVG